LPHRKGLTCIIKLIHYYSDMAQALQDGRGRFGFRLDIQSGVPVYRQIIDQVTGGMASGALKPGDQLPTVRQLAVDLAINPNTVVRAYRELEIRGLLETQQGTGTFVGQQKVKRDQVERQRRLNQIVSEFVARAGAGGFTVQDLMEELRDLQADQGKRGR
jgi:GntR family transcriptional regulator